MQGGREERGGRGGEERVWVLKTAVWIASGTQTFQHNPSFALRCDQPTTESGNTVDVEVCRTTAPPESYPLTTIAHSCRDAGRSTLLNRTSGGQMPNQW